MLKHKILWCSFALISFTVVASLLLSAMDEGLQINPDSFSIDLVGGDEITKETTVRLNDDNAGLCTISTKITPDGQGIHVNYSTTSPFVLKPDIDYKIKITVNASMNIMPGVYTITTNFSCITGTPNIINVTLKTSIPLDTETGFGWENISCSINSKIDINEVILFWNAESFLMNKKDNYNYYYNTTHTTPGMHTYYICVDDICGNENTSKQDTFWLPSNEDVDMNRQTHFSDLMDVIRMYGVHGPDGWVREDVDNNGQVHFMDLIQVVFHWNEQW